MSLQVVESSSSDGHIEDSDEELGRNNVEVVVKEEKGDLIAINVDL